MAACDSLEAVNKCIVAAPMTDRGAVFYAAKPTLERPAVVADALESVARSPSISTTSGAAGRSALLG
jgi:hypothetical protein